MLLSCSRGHPNPSSHRFCQQCGERLEQAIPAGKVICDRYRVIEELGRGGFGQTYLVTDSNRFDERCVLKVFAPEVEGTKALNKAKELFTREAEVLYRLEHPQIPKFREWFMEAQSLYLVQDYVEGQTYQALLRHRQQQGQFFSEPEVAHFLRQTLPILAYIHGKGMIHRDISPDNLMRRESDGQPVLIDFGGVKEITASFGHFSGKKVPGVTLIGKPGYAPEEQIRLGQVSAASDIYALGVTALVLLVGKEPQNFFDPNTCRFNWQRFVQLSPGFADVLEKMVASHAVNRYRAAAQVLQDLKHLEIAEVVGNADSMSGSVSNGQVISEPPVQSTLVFGATASPVTQQTVVVSADDRPTTKVGGRLQAGLARLIQAILIVAVMLLAGVLGFGAVYNWLQQRPAQSTSTESPVPEDEQQRKQELFRRLRTLNVGTTYFNQVTNEAFYLKYPDYPRRPLTTGAEDAPLRAQWDQMGTQILDVLDDISPASRQRIGRYGATTRQTWNRQLRQARVDRRRFYREVDRQFQQQLPMYRPTALDDKRGQQIWYALAADRLAQELQRSDS